MAHPHGATGNALFTRAFRHPYLTRGIVHTPFGRFLVHRGIVHLPDDTGRDLGWELVEPEDSPGDHETVPQGDIGQPDPARLR
jgi:hypothetical protein